MVPRWFRVHDPEKDAWSWFEVSDDRSVLRQAVFAANIPLPVPDSHVSDINGATGCASVAASADELARVHERYGLPGVRFYEAIYGVLTEEPVDTPQGSVESTPAEFERVWRDALHDRHLSRCDTGPLPAGTRVSGTVTAVPWGPGRTGLFVDIDSVAPGFVDLIDLPRDDEDWPQVGSVLSLEVTTVRISLHSLYGHSDIQVRLRPVE